jgi:hypothetical protein
VIKPIHLVLVWLLVIEKCEIAFRPLQLMHMYTKSSEVDLDKAPAISHKNNVERLASKYDYAYGKVTC